MEKSTRKIWGNSKTYEFSMSQIRLCCMEWLQTEWIWKDLYITKHEFGLSKKSSENWHYIKTITEIILLIVNLDISQRRHTEGYNAFNPGNVHRIPKLTAKQDAIITDRIRDYPQEWKIHQSCDKERDNCNFCINGEVGELPKVINLVIIFQYRLTKLIMSAELNS